MTPNSLRRFAEAVPFRDFTIHMSDGRFIRVSHPKMILLTEGGQTAIVSTGGEDFEIISTPLITSAKPTTQKKKKKG